MGGFAVVHSPFSNRIMATLERTVVVLSEQLSFGTSNKIVDYTELNHVSQLSR
jgi:hypothetical protein